MVPRGPRVSPGKRVEFDLSAKRCTGFSLYHKIVKTQLLVLDYPHSPLPPIAPIFGTN